MKQDAKKSDALKKPGALKSQIDVSMLELLACPLTKGPLTWDPEKSELVSRVAKLAYPVRDGIPVLLPSEGRPIDID